VDFSHRSLYTQLVLITATVENTLFARWLACGGVVDTKIMEEKETA
jgi:hypothetical protein